MSAVSPVAPGAVPGAAPGRLSRRAFGIIFAVSLATAAGNTGLQSVLPAIGRQIGIADWLIAAIFSLSALLWTVSAPIWARESDKRGRKPLIALGLAGFVISMTGCALVVLAGLHRIVAPLAVFAGFTLLRAVFGLIGSAASPASQAYVADRTEGEARTESLSQLAGATGLGTIAGPAIAPLFVLPFITLSGPMFAFALGAAAVLGVTLRFLPERRKPAVFMRPKFLTRSGRLVAPPDIGAVGAPGADRGLWRDPRIFPFLLYGLLAGSAQAVNGYTLGFLIIDKLHIAPLSAQRLIAVAMMAGALAQLLAQWGLIRLFRMQASHLLVWGAALAGLGNLAMAAAPNYSGVVFAYALISLGFGFARPGFTAGSSLAATEAEQGAVAGLVTAANGATVIAAPVLGVMLYERAGFAPFVMNAAILSGLLAYALRNAALRRGGAPARESDSAQATLDFTEGGGTG